MYESFYGLAQRPFSATPDPDCYVPVPATEAALAEMRLTVAGGQGIAVLTAPPGLGKTLACLRLTALLGDDFACVWLPTANYRTRRSLLQAILYELGRPYAQMAEQELRLQLISTARTQAGRDRAVVVIVDEAHLLSPRLLEELRALTNVAAAGRSLIRIVLCGQLALEETLAEPELSALNQRINCQATLVPLSMQESHAYLAARVQAAGAELVETFTADAAQLICQASDGNPRCLNQLADQALVLGFQRTARPVTAAIVHEALDELKQLPLCWNEPAGAIAGGAEGTTDPYVSGTTVEFEPSTSGCRGSDRAGGNAVEPAAASAIEVGSGMEALSAGHRGAFEGGAVLASVEVGAGDSTARRCEPVQQPARGQVAPPSSTAAIRQTVEYVEEPVIDRYAMLDAGLVPPKSMCAPTAAPQTVRSAEAPRRDGSEIEEEIASLVLDTCLETQQSLGIVADDDVVWSEPLDERGDFDVSDEIVEAPAAGARLEFDVVQPDSPTGESDCDESLLRLPPGERIEREDAPGSLRPPRHYGQLFSELRRRHRQRM